MIIFQLNSQSDLKDENPGPVREPSVKNDVAGWRSLLVTEKCTSQALANGLYNSSPPPAKL